MNTVTKDQMAEQAAENPLAMSRPASEATRIEQSRAVAEVYGAIMVARQSPRDEARAWARMREGCGNIELAKRAFFRFPRGGQQITGPSVHLARELARCWGNIDYGIKELSRDDAGGRSEMLAFAWDLETNARNETAFIVPHLRDKKGGPQRIVDVRDVYENNANQGARRVRECVFAILPPHFIEEAKAICHRTLEHGGGVPMAKRLADMFAAFGEIGVSRAQIERRAGRSADSFTGVEIAQMQVIYQSIRRGEVTREDEFPDDAAAKTTAALKGHAPAPQEQREPAGDAGDAGGAHMDPSNTETQKSPLLTILKADGTVLCDQNGVTLELEPAAFARVLTDMMGKADDLTGLMMANAQTVVKLPPDLRGQIESEQARLMRPTQTEGA